MPWYITISRNTIRPDILSRILKKQLRPATHCSWKRSSSQHPWRNLKPHRGSEQLLYIFKELYKEKAAEAIPKKYEELGELIAIDGTLIDAVMTMYWGRLQQNEKKAKGHFGLNINRSTIQCYLTTGKDSERAFVPMILKKGQTGMDQDYQCHRSFDLLQRKMTNSSYAESKKALRKLLSKKIK